MSFPDDVSAAGRFGARRREIVFTALGAAAFAVLAPRAVFSAEAGDAKPGSQDPLTVTIEDLVASGHILSNEGTIDAFGHVSARHPLRTDHFLMSRARAPGLSEADDIMEFDAAGQPVDARGRHPYLERFIHAAVYEARPDVRSVIHDHSPELVPFSVSAAPLRPLAHSGGLLGEAVPVWDIEDKFGGGTNLLVVNLDIGRDLARRLGRGSAILMRGHGAVATGASIRLATYLAISLDIQARLQREAMALGKVKYLSKGEVAATAKIFDPATPGDAVGRAWEYWCARAHIAFNPQGA